MKCRYCGLELSPKVLIAHEPICKMSTEKNPKVDKEVEKEVEKYVTKKTKKESNK